MKITLDPNKLEEVASKLRAMAHPMRIAVIELLEREGELNVTQIYEALKIEQATASHHLNILKAKKVLNARRDGKKTFYSVYPNSMINIAECIHRCDNH
jgi:ArsR family transcriptional regulator